MRPMRNARNILSHPADRVAPGKQSEEGKHEYYTLHAILMCLVVHHGDMGFEWDMSPLIHRNVPAKAAFDLRQE